MRSEQSWFGLPAVASTASSIAAFAAAVAPKTTAATAATTASLRFRPSFINIDGAAAHLASVERGDCFLAVFVVGHFNETEAPRPSRIAVHHDADTIHWPVGFEGLPEFVLVGVEAEIADKDVFHGSAPCIELSECKLVSADWQVGRAFLKSRPELATVKCGRKYSRFLATGCQDE